MLTRLRPHLTFANITATLAFTLVLTALLAHPRNTVDAAPATGTWFMGGTTTQIPTCTNCNFILPAVGLGTAGSSNRANDVLSPSVAITVSQFTVQVINPPAGGQPLTFVLGVDPTHSIRCTIPGGQTTCNSAATTATIPANSFLSVAVVNGGAPATLVKYNWLGTPQ